MRKSIYETILNDMRFEILVKAVQNAGLWSTLSASGPFTMFAPTDEAFFKLPNGSIMKLLEDSQGLNSILSRHVLNGKVMESDLVGWKKAQTLKGQDLEIEVDDGLKVDGAKVIQADVHCRNGVIHVIDRVLIPK